MHRVPAVYYSVNVHIQRQSNFDWFFVSGGVHYVFVSDGVFFVLTMSHVYNYVVQLVGCLRATTLYSDYILQSWYLRPIFIFQPPPLPLNVDIVNNRSLMLTGVRVKSMYSTFLKSTCYVNLLPKLSIIFKEWRVTRTLSYT